MGTSPDHSNGDLGDSEDWVAPGLMPTKDMRSRLYAGPCDIPSCLNRQEALPPLVGCLTGRRRRQLLERSVQARLNGMLRYKATQRFHSKRSTEPSPGGKCFPLTTTASLWGLLMCLRYEMTGLNATLLEPSGCKRLKRVLSPSAAALQHQLATMAMLSSFM